MQKKIVALVASYQTLHFLTEPQMKQTNEFGICIELLPQAG